MGVSVLRRARELGRSFVLAPERFDPRRQLASTSTRRIGDVVDIVTENVSVESNLTEHAVLVLDTTHAYEGFVVLRHEPIPPTQVGSAKRRLVPGDVIISRLRPYLRQVAYVDEELFRLNPAGNSVCASTEFFVLRGRDGFEAAALIPFLLTERVQTVLAAGQEGGHHPRFSKELLSSISVPDVIVDNASAISGRQRELASAIRGALNGSRALVASLQREP